MPTNIALPSSLPQPHHVSETQADLLSSSASDKHEVSPWQSNTLPTSVCSAINPGQRNKELLDLLLGLCLLGTEGRRALVRYLQEQQV